jgi:hypothetical protein
MYKFITKKFDYLIPLLIAVFSFFVAYHNTGTGIINYVDHKFPFDFGKLFSNQIYTWNDNIYLGFNQSLSLLLNLSYTSLFTLIQKIISDYIIVNRLEYALAIFCNFYFTYLFITSIFLEKLSKKQKMLVLLCCSFFFTNVLSSALYYMGISQQIFAFSFVPLSLYGIRKYFLTKKKSYLFLAIFSCFFIASVNLPYSFLAVIAVMLVILSFNDLGSKVKIKVVLLFGVLFVSLNAYWLIPFGYSTAIAPPPSYFKTIDSSENKNVFDDYLELTSGRYSLDQLFKLAPNFSLIKTQNGDNSLFVYYLGSSYIIFLSYLAAILVLGYSLYSKKQKNKILLNSLPLVIFFLFFIFLAKGQNEPLANLYPFLLEKTVFFKMFRDPLKWMIVPYLIFIILSANLLVNARSKIIKTIVILFFVSYLFPWTYKGLMERLRAYDVPNYYFQLADSYRKVQGISDKRAVILDSSVGYTSYKFDTKNLKPISSNILKSISPLPVVDLFSNGGGLAFDYLNVFFGNLKKTDEDLYAFQKIGATHIYHQKDINNPSTYKYTSKYFNKTNFGKLDVYEIKKEYILPKIFLSGTEEQAEVIFSKVNPTKYAIRINNLKGKTYLNFLYTFDQNWEIYPKKFNQSSDCTVIQESSITDKNNAIDNYGENNTTSKECAIQEKFYQGDELGYLRNKGVFTDGHVLLNKLFNKWTIDPEYIKQNFSKEYYSENPDGSINVDLKLYFKPQSYFYLGLIISGLTLLGITGYFAYDWRRRRIIKSRLLKK